MAVHTKRSCGDYSYATFECRPPLLDDGSSIGMDGAIMGVVNRNRRSGRRRDVAAETEHDDEVPCDSISDIYDSPIMLEDSGMPEYATVNKSKSDIYDTVADPVVGSISADDLYAVVDKSKKHRERYTHPEKSIPSEDSEEQSQLKLKSSNAYTTQVEFDNLYEDPEKFNIPPQTREVENLTEVDDTYAEIDVSSRKLLRQPPKQRSRKGKSALNKGNEFTFETAQETGYAFINGTELVDSSRDMKKERGSRKKKGEKTQFFVPVNEKEDPFDAPLQDSLAKKQNLRRKLSLPVSPVPNECSAFTEFSSDMRERLNSNGRQSFSLEDLMGNYVDIKEENTEKKPVSFIKSHRRIRSSDGFNFSKRSSVDMSSLNSDYLDKKQSVLKANRKQSQRMRSHENVSKVFSGTQHGSQTDLSKTDRESSPQSGKASVESSVSSDSSMSVPSKGSRGSVGSVDSTDMDMRQLLQQAEELVPDELPEGWQEVRDGNETYYWHIWTGTIQYERPMLSTSSSSRSVSPMSSQDSCPSTNTSASDLRGGQSKSPQLLSRSESPPSNIKQAISFPVHSMGWLEVEEEKMATSCLGETVNRCITTLAAQRNDLWNTSNTWGEGKDIKLILEGEVLKLYEPREKVVMLNQPIAKMRVWGVGKEEQRDFAYIARDPQSGKHRCHMFRCHGHMSGRSITNALHSICNRVLEEKRRAKERASPSVKTASDLLHAPVPQTAKDSSGFNEKPFIEQKKSFTAKYVGFTEVSKPSGIDILNKAVAKLTTGVASSNWKPVLVDITTSEIRTIDCTNQDVIMEDRVRFISFLGIAKDEKMCGYVVAVGQDAFVCHVFMCAPHAGILTKAIEEACRLRYEKVLDRRALKGRHITDSQINETSHRSMMKEKGLGIKSSMQELFHKFQKKDNKRRVSKDEGSQTSPENKSPPLQPGANEYMVKYFGCVQVTIGTGNETVQHSVEQLSGGSMMIGYLEVTMDTLTLYDSQRTNLSRRVIDLDTVSYCGMTGDGKYFGIIVTQGRGKYVCHVFQEYKTPVDKVVKAISDVM